MSRKQELEQNIIELYSEGSSFTYGSLVHEYPGARVEQEKAFISIQSVYGEDASICSMGLEYGYASFADIVVGKKRFFANNPPAAGIYSIENCLFILLCNYLNIYVLGEHSYYHESGFSYSRAREAGDFLPEFSCIDKFQNISIESLSNNITELLAKSSYERVHSEDLDSYLIKSIKLQSNLMGEPALLYDGYFNWTD